MAGIIAALGASLLRALVAVRAGLVIGAAAFLELAIAAANESAAVTGTLTGFFEAISKAFGVLSVLAGILFVLQQIWTWPRR